MGSDLGLQTVRFEIKTCNIEVSFAVIVFRQFVARIRLALVLINTRYLEGIMKITFSYFF